MFAKDRRALIVMLRNVLKAVALLTLAALAVQAQPAPGTVNEKTTARKQHRLPKKKKEAVKTAPVVTPPPPPPAPKTPAEMPPVPPKVTYQNGLLTIDAPNSTLGAVLEAVKRATGAQMDPVQASDRVIVHIGPGNPKDVLASLLSGSRYDYVILGSAENPDAIQQIILTSGSNAPVTPPQQQAGFVRTPPEEENPKEEEPQAPRYRPVPQPSRPFQARPMPPDQTTSPRQQPEGNAQNPNESRTPQQLFNELRRMEQQRAQQQLKQPPPQNPQ